ncbi:MAG TPA: hypothetical protein VFB13_03735 [Reyranella sp.]|nr:hypothetical protein [Reyranella sp.]
MAGDQLSNSILRTIGSIAVHHAEVEYWVDAMVHSVHTYIPGAKKYGKKYPINFRTELEFLWNCFLHLPSMKPFRAQGLKLLQRINKAHEDRSDILHSYITRWDKKTKQLSFSRVWKSPDTGEPEGRRISITEQGLVADAKRLDTLRYTVRKFAQRLREACLPKKDANEALRGLRG